jgi:predicted DNA-binding transcriptional regulator YafY
MLRGRPLRTLEDRGLSLTELCALYFSRDLLGTLAGGPFAQDLERAVAAIERALPRSCRRFLDALPVTLKSKLAGRKAGDTRRLNAFANRALEASLKHRRITMRYYSDSSRRTKQYVVEPLRMSYADGGVYLSAFVPEYGQMRTFALERVQTMEVLNEAFTPRPLPVEPFANSLRVHTGPAERVEIEFVASAADYVTSREWHCSQTFERRADGSVLLRLDVSIDRPLRAWILGFGASARVLVPAGLARDLARELQRAAANYVPDVRFEMLRVRDAQRGARVLRTG